MAPPKTHLFASNNKAWCGHYGDYIGPRLRDNLDNVTCISCLRTYASAHYKKIHIYKELNPYHKRSYRMWKGYCYLPNCKRRSWQFWFFGATLGYGLEHIRRHHGSTL